VGAGIGGAVLALELGRRGHHVVILEREPYPRRIVRPEVLWKPTLDALDQLGVGERIRREASVQLSEIDIGGLLVMEPKDFTAAGAQAFSTDPLLTRQLIVAEAETTGNVEVHRGVEVASLLKDADFTHGVVGIRGEERIEFFADLTVGDDGVNSMVRKSLGVPIDLRLFPMDFLTAGIRWPSALAPDCCKVFLNCDAFRDGIPVAALIPWPKGEGVLLIPLPPARAASLLATPSDDFRSMFAQTTPLADTLLETFKFPSDIVRVTRPFGHAATYVGDGVALIGDAAHPMTPAGGQGANASIWDALALAGTADEALKTANVSRQRLAPYETRRRVINERSVRISRTALTAFRIGHAVPLSLMVPFMLSAMQFLNWPKRRVLRQFSSTFSHKPN
jgi:2-polyprenyl-6-methoxyphenol hydroxylase-like FAD-dependent oxidoreductase